MNKLIFIKVVLLICFLFVRCGTNKYISDTATNSSNYEGLWQFRDHTDRTLTITKIEEEVYNLKFDSETNDWEGIGYQVDDELLAIFKYFDIGKKGYITFKFSEKDKIQFQSIDPYGEYRSEGYFIRITLP
jgi:hypothetical protein